jgi:hypothetical protein
MKVAKMERRSGVGEVDIKGTYARVQALGQIGKGGNSRWKPPLYGPQ